DVPAVGAQSRADGVEHFFDTIAWRHGASVPSILRINLVRGPGARQSGIFPTSGRNWRKGVTGTESGNGIQRRGTAAGAGSVPVGSRGGWAHWPARPSRPGSPAAYSRSVMLLPCVKSSR